MQRQKRSSVIKKNKDSEEKIMMKSKCSGVLMHLSSLPSEYGIGTMGVEARKFVDFLEAAGQSYWQMLPICPTSYGDSPYQSFSTYAGNLYFIDLDLLCEQGLLLPEEYKERDWGNDPKQVDYGKIYESRYPVLRKAAERFAEQIPESYETFCRNNAYWLDDYALFMALKEAHDGKPWQEWEPELRNRDKNVLDLVLLQYMKKIQFWKIIQYLFFEQWKALRTYANEHGVKIIGDLPIYVSLDSVDVWAHPELFQLDGDKVPKEVAGCPPDGFSAD